MAGKSARQIRSRWYPAIGTVLATVLCLVSVWAVFKRFTVSTIAPSTLEPLLSPSETFTKAAGQPTSVPPATPGTITLPTSASTKQTDVPAGKQSTGTASIRQGVLRVGNPTGYPVRVVLLSQTAVVEAGLSGGSASPNAKAVPSSYEPPAHWDFAPAEGGTQGLLVSLPDRTLKIKKGDVLVAFAQDGSGRYWGPYVVGETAFPTWNAKAVEWQLILQP